MLNQELSIIILAAGKGTRMFSNLPKVLHPLAGKTIIKYVIDTASKLKPTHIHLVYSNEWGPFYKKFICHNPIINWVLQSNPRGTGHAVQQTLSELKDNENIIILCGDVPLISSNTLHKLLQAKPKNGISLLTVISKNPDGYGRIIRNNHNKVSNIVEHKNANKQQRRIKEINSGIIAINSNNLKQWINKININNSQKEIYLTDIIAIAYNEGYEIKTIKPNDPNEIKGVNNHFQLAWLERFYQLKQAKRLLLAGIRLLDPSRFDLRGELYHGQDVFIDINVILEGKVILGNRVNIGAGCILKNVIIDDDVIINPYTIIENAKLAINSVVGPFARLRPDSHLDEGVHVGNFVEIKKTHLGKNSKVGHLSYLGNAEIGSNVNIGAGTITCNYDGINKHKTIIGNDVFIGSDSQLIAPLTINDRATIGAGTTVTKDIAAGEVIISRIKQFPITNWTRPIKKK